RAQRPPAAAAPRGTPPADGSRWPRLVVVGHRRGDHCRPGERRAARGRAGTGGRGRPGAFSKARPATREFSGRRHERLVVLMLALELEEGVVAAGLAVGILAAHRGTTFVDRAATLLG